VGARRRTAQRPKGISPAVSRRSVALLLLETMTRF
jgi:hypothetical protein